MKKAYLGCLKKLRQFRKSILSDKDIKRGLLYFNWIETKTEKITLEECEKEKNCINEMLARNS